MECGNRARVGIGTSLQPRRAALKRTNSGIITSIDSSAHDGVSRGGIGLVVQHVPLKYSSFPSARRLTSPAMARGSLWHDGGTDQYAIAAIKPAQSRARQYSVIKRMRRRAAPSTATPQDKANG